MAMSEKQFRSLKNRILGIVVKAQKEGRRNGIYDETCLLRGQLVKREASAYEDLLSFIPESGLRDMVEEEVGGAYREAYLDGKQEAVNEMRKLLKSEQEGITLEKEAADLEEGSGTFEKMPEDGFAIIGGFGTAVFVGDHMARFKDFY